MFGLSNVLPVWFNCFLVQLLKLQGMAEVEHAQPGLSTGVIRLRMPSPSSESLSFAVEKQKKTCSSARTNEDLHCLHLQVMH